MATSRSTKKKVKHARLSPLSVGHLIARSMGITDLCVCSVWVRCGVPSPPVVGPLRGPLLCVGPLQGPSLSNWGSLWGPPLRYSTTLLGSRLYMLNTRGGGE